MRVHNSGLKLIVPSDRSSRQQISRKPAGLWWSPSTIWLGFVDDGKAGKRRTQPFNYVVEVEFDAKVASLDDWQSIREFTAEYGSPPQWASQAMAFSATERLDSPQKLGGRLYVNVPCIDWRRVAATYDGIEIGISAFADPSRPRLEWLDVDWGVPSGCAWRMDRVGVDGPYDREALEGLLALGDAWAPSV